MTGFGRGQVESSAFRLTAEIKTLNHRYLDFHIKMPRKLNYLEEDIRKRIKASLSRGRIELYIQLEFLDGNDYTVEPNYGMIDQYYAAIKGIAERYDLSQSVYPTQLATLNDALSVRSNDLDEEEMKGFVLDAVDKALSSVLDMRVREGAALKQAILEHIDSIERTAKKIATRSSDIVRLHKEKMMHRVTELLGSADFDEQRILTEVAIFADKSNIDEELVRLSTHCQQLKSYLTEVEPTGRKIDFLIQEMNREVNTIGSKSPDVDIASDVVALKSDIEKLREQIQNIE